MTRLAMVLPLVLLLSGVWQHALAEGPLDEANEKHNKAMQEYARQRLSLGANPPAEQVEALRQKIVKPADEAFKQDQAKALREGINKGRAKGKQSGVGASFRNITQREKNGGKPADGSEPAKASANKAKINPKAPPKEGETIDGSKLEHVIDY
jgi:hypothetical protein